MNPKENNTFAALDAKLAAESTGVRKRGLVRLAVGIAGTFAVAGILFWVLPASRLEVTPKGLMLAAIPGAYGLVGLMEVATGISYGQWARKWDSMKGWQRGVLGLIIVCAFFALILGVVAIAF